MLGVSRANSTVWSNARTLLRDTFARVIESRSSPKLAAPAHDKDAGACEAKTTAASTSAPKSKGRASVKSPTNAFRNSRLSSILPERWWQNIFKRTTGAQRRPANDARNRSPIKEPKLVYLFASENFSYNSPQQKQYNYKQQQQQPEPQQERRKRRRRSKSGDENPQLERASPTLEKWWLCRIIGVTLLFVAAISVVAACVFLEIGTLMPLMWRLVYIPLVGTIALSSITMTLFRATADITPEVCGQPQKKTPASLVSRSVPNLRDPRAEEFVRDPPPRVFLENTLHLRPGIIRPKCKHKFHWATLPRRQIALRKWRLRRDVHQGLTPPATAAGPPGGRTVWRRQQQPPPGWDALLPPLKGVMINNFCLRDGTDWHMRQQQQVMSFMSPLSSWQDGRSSCMSSMYPITGVLADRRRRRRIARLRRQIAALERFEELEEQRATGWSPTPTLVVAAPIAPGSLTVNNANSVSTMSPRQREEAISTAIMNFWMSPAIDESPDRTVIVHV